jgi:TM2 domain-containing membrane protein YozV
MSKDTTSTLQPKDSTVAAPNPWLAALLSFLLPGAGQALNGRFWKGVLLLVLSFVILPAESAAVAYVGNAAAWALLTPLLTPWVYSMISAALEANQLNRTGASYDKRRGAMGVAVLLIVVFPAVALVFSVVTLLSLPLETLQLMADWSERLKRACGFGA